MTAVTSHHRRALTVRSRGTRRADYQDAMNRTVGLLLVAVCVVVPVTTAPAQSRPVTFLRPMPRPVTSPASYASSLPSVTPAGVGDTTIKGGRPVLSFALATVTGAAGAVIGYGTGLIVFGCSDEGAYCEGGPDNMDVMLGVTGIVLGAAAGAHLGGLRRESAGRWLPTIAATAAGLLPMAFGSHQGASVALVLTPVAAAAADHMFRRKR